MLSFLTVGQTFSYFHYSPVQVVLSENFNYQSQLKCFLLEEYVPQVANHPKQTHKNFWGGPQRTQNLCKPRSWVDHIPTSFGVFVPATTSCSEEEKEHTRFQAIWMDGIAEETEGVLDSIADFKAMGILDRNVDLKAEEVQDQIAAIDDMEEATRVTLINC